MIQFETIQGESGRWRWMIMQAGECLATSTRSFLTELDCLLEIEKIRSSVATPPVSPGNSKVTYLDGSVAVW